MLDHFLRFVIKTSTGRPWTVVIVALLLTAVTGWLAIFRLHMDADTDHLIAPERPYMKTYRKFLDEFGDLEFIHAVIMSKDDAHAEQAIDSLAQKLKEIKELPGIYYCVEPAEQLNVALRAMSDQELEELATAAAGLPEITSGRSAGAALDLSHTLLQRLLGAGIIKNEARQRELGGGALLLLHAIAAADPTSQAAKDMATLAGTGMKREYLVSENKKLRFVNIMPVKDYGTMAVIEEPLRRIRSAIAEVKKEFPDVDMGITGKPVLQADEMSTTNDDMTLASILGLILTGIPFMIVIGGVVRPLLAMAAFTCGITWTFGLAAMTVGSLNLLSVVFVPILVGIGLDFGVTIVLRYIEERPNRSVVDSLSTALLTAGRGNITGALTQCAAFYMAMFTNFQGLRELGFIAGSGLVISLLAITWVLPALIVLHERRRKTPEVFKKKDVENTREARFFGLFLRRPGLALGGAAIVTIALIPQLFRLDFQENLLELQAKGLDSVVWEKKIIDNSDNSVWFGALTATTEEEAAALVEKAKALPTVGGVHSIFDAVKPTTPARKKIYDALTERMKDPGSFVGTEKPLTTEALYQVAREVRSLGGLAKEKAPEEAVRLETLGKTLEKMSKDLALGDAAAKALAQRIEATYRTIGTSLGTMLAALGKPTKDILPATVRSEFMASSGRFLVMAHPKENVWEMDAMSRFVQDLRTIDPNATGAPITHLESIIDMKDGFIMAALYSILVVLFLVWFDFRTIRETLLAGLPLFIGLLWTIQSMGLTGIDFNLANFFAAPILIGICIDNGVHILHRYREGGPNRLTLASTRRAIMLTSINNVFGFGCMATAAHRGLRSLGLVMALGAFGCMVSSLVILPPLLAWVEKRRGAPPPAAH